MSFQLIPLQSTDDFRLESKETLLARTMNGEEQLVYDETLDDYQGYLDGDFMNIREAYESRIRQIKEKIRRKEISSATIELKMIDISHGKKYLQFGIIGSILQNLPSGQNIYSDQIRVDYKIYNLSKADAAEMKKNIGQAEYVLEKI